MTEAKRTAYPVLSLIRRGGREHAPGGEPIELTDEEFASLRDTGAIDTTPVGGVKTSGGASPTSKAPAGEAGADGVPDRSGEERVSDPSGDQASEVSGAGSGEPAPPTDHGRKGGRKRKT